MQRVRFPACCLLIAPLPGAQTEQGSHYGSLLSSQKQAAELQDLSQLLPWQHILLGCTCWRARQPRACRWDHAGALLIRVPAPGAMPTALGMGGRDAQLIPSTWGLETHLGMNTATAKGLHASFPPPTVARSQPRSSAPFQALTPSSEPRGPPPLTPGHDLGRVSTAPQGAAAGSGPEKGSGQAVQSHTSPNTSASKRHKHSPVPTTRCGGRTKRQRSDRSADPELSLHHTVHPPPHTASPPTVFSILFP